MHKFESFLCQKNVRDLSALSLYYSFMHLKRFFEWIGLKERLDSRIMAAPHVSEGELWWASLGENVGAEINGKSRDFSRPVLIFRKLSSGFYFVIPLTTQMRTGSWYVSYQQGDKECTACLHQARSIDYRRLHSRLGELDEVDFLRVQEAFQKLYMKISPAISGRVAGNPRK